MRAGFFSTSVSSPGVTCCAPPSMEAAGSSSIPISKSPPCACSHAGVATGPSATATVTITGYLTSAVDASFTNTATVDPFNTIAEYVETNNVAIETTNVLAPTVTPTPTNTAPAPTTPTPNSSPPANPPPAVTATPHAPPTATATTPASN